MSKAYDSELWSDAVNGYHQMVVDVEDIDNAPTIEPKQEWIPCEERLPEDDRDVLVQMSDDTMMVDSRAASSNGWFWAEIGDEPVAWMPLPEPYERRG